MTSATVTTRYAIGISGSSDGLHAIEMLDEPLPDGRRGARAPRGPQYHRAECDALVVAASRWGDFSRDNERISRRGLDFCPHCAWTVALTHGAVEQELAAVLPNEAEQRAWARLLPDPTLSARVVQAILDERAKEDLADPDSGLWPQLLGTVTAHRPSMLVLEECAEGDCDHDAEPDSGACMAISDTIVCHACSVIAGPWAGEYEGLVEVAVPAPCSVLTAMAGRFLGEKVA